MTSDTTGTSKVFSVPWYKSSCRPPIHAGKFAEGADLHTRSLGPNTIKLYRWGRGEGSACHTYYVSNRTGFAETSVVINVTHTCHDGWKQHDGPRCTFYVLTHGSIRQFSRTVSCAFVEFMGRILPYKPYSPFQMGGPCSMRAESVCVWVAGDHQKDSEASLPASALHP